MKKEPEKLIPLSTLELRTLLLYVQVRNAHKKEYKEALRDLKNK